MRVDKRLPNSSYFRFLSRLILPALVELSLDISALLTGSKLRVDYVLGMSSSIVARKLNGWQVHTLLVTEFLWCYVLRVHLMFGALVWHFGHCAPSVNLSSLIRGSFRWLARLFVPS